MSGYRPLEQADDFSRLYDQTYLAVFRFIFGLRGGPQEEVEDLTAETFYKAWNARHRFQGNQAAALGWLFQIARNLVIDQSRRKKTRGNEQSLDDLQLTEPGAGPEELTDQQQQEQILLEMLQELPLEQREIILLRYGFNWPVKRIAEHFGMVENTVSVKIRRAIIRIRRDWPERY